MGNINQPVMYILRKIMRVYNLGNINVCTNLAEGLFEPNTFITGYVLYIMVKVTFDISEAKRNKLLSLVIPKENISKAREDEQINVMCNYIIKDYLSNNA